MEARIRALAAHAPEKTLSNEELTKFVDTTDEWIFSHTGIRSRHIAAADESASDIALPACRKVLESTGTSAEEIDLILVATSTPDYISMPSTACIIQHQLGANAAGAMDITAACSGFVYALEIARNFVVAGSARNVLVVATEVYSKIVNWKDRNTCVLFGDGAGAALVSPADDSRRGLLHHAFLRSDGSGAESLVRLHGGTRRPTNADSTEADLMLSMDGRKVYNFAVRAVNETILEVLEREKLTIDDIDYFVPHQANVRIIEAAAKRLGAPVERFYMNMERYANTSASSIPLAIGEMQDRGLLKPGMKLITIGFGAGLTYGGGLIEW
ncbi:MAG: ketoacyl-ACP synthase III [Spirochaetaceae bacterium]|nr:MAG: ketoacyl-ACP synthase III [Spirochaetaceae bacterium]